MRLVDKSDAGEVMISELGCNSCFVELCLSTDSGAPGLIRFMKRCFGSCAIQCFRGKVKKYIFRYLFTWTTATIKKNPCDVHKHRAGISIRRIYLYFRWKDYLPCTYLSPPPPPSHVPPPLRRFFALSGAGGGLFPSFSPPPPSPSSGST